VNQRDGEEALLPLFTFCEELTIFDQADLIFGYSRPQAIQDGVLVDVSDTAREAGVYLPTALTRAVWERYVREPEGV
jgi:hypothetical protein